MWDTVKLLIIEPSSRRRSRKPVIDELTRRMTAAYRESTYGFNYRGYRSCTCGAFSDNHGAHSIFIFKPATVEIFTTSLCVHYLAFHRDEVPKEELEKVAALPFGEAEPNQEELYGTKYKY